MIRWKGIGDNVKKRFFVFGILIVILSLATVVFANGSGCFSISNCSVKIGSSTEKIQYPLYMNDNRIYISLRNICDELGIPLKWDDERREATVDIYNKKLNVSDKTPIKEDGVIPDKETAYTVGKVILEKYAQKPLEYETDEKNYYLIVEFSEQYNSWIIRQTFEFKDKESGWAGGDGLYTPFVILSKNTGEVLYVNTYSSLTAND